MNKTKKRRTRKEAIMKYSRYAFCSTRGQSPRKPHFCSTQTLEKVEPNLPSGGGLRGFTPVKSGKTCKVTTIPDIDKDIDAIIDINAIRHNVKYLKQQSGTDLMPVLKANAYGHGIVEMAKILRKLGIKYIGVATLGEAILLRKSGDKGRILAWLFDVDGHELVDAFKLDIDVAIFDEATIPKFISRIPKNQNGKIKVTIFVDTGINRASVPYDKAVQAFIDVSKCPNIELVGMMSHLVCSQIKNSPIVNEQLRKFRALRKELEEIGIKPPLVHIANTNACLNYDVSDFTLSRSGSGIYGLTEPQNKNMRLTTSLKTYVIQTREVDKGQGIGYDWKYITPRKMRVCVLPIGYGDMLPRDMSLKMNVYINGTKRKVLGLLSMDQIVVESKNCDKVNDEAYIFGNGKNCPQTVVSFAEGSNQIPVEILSHMGDRVNRKYI
jgi:alanine racemase